MQLQRTAEASAPASIQDLKRKDEGRFAAVLNLIHRGSGEEKTAEAAAETEKELGERAKQKLEDVFTKENVKQYLKDAYKSTAFYTFFLTFYMFSPIPGLGVGMDLSQYIAWLPNQAIQVPLLGIGYSQIMRHLAAKNPPKTQTEKTKKFARDYLVTFAYWTAGQTPWALAPFGLHLNPQQYLGWAEAGAWLSPLLGLPYAKFIARRAGKKNAGAEGSSPVAEAEIQE